ncbi:hypothetical protein PNOK_0853900 [Pyrrhoderma noxium]|uniref:Uncharacterized protein n=1 Tax=Pyrrhoderma noxium TaxID=2282107 RepID=A0A286U7X9_9AGAM|nr:hypothetical protein PNOK_0853900 [Pyrrhoderma noxium]
MGREKCKMWRAHKFRLGFGHAALFFLVQVYYAFYDSDVRRSFHTYTFSIMYSIICVVYILLVAKHVVILDVIPDPRESLTLTR